jgi:aspartyl-tRNA(Asn)/glutamyl-tRNA(Gln) amidotransferase subunit C
MTSDRSVVTPEVVRKVAELARLRVPDGELARWAEQLGRIVAYIDQLAAIPEEAYGAPAEGPSTPVRGDQPRDGGGRAALEANAPRLSHDYGVVPRVVGSGN